MQMPFEFVFIRPWWLLLIPVGLLLAYAATRIYRDSWQRVCDGELFTELTLISDRGSEKFIWLAIIVGWTLAVLALAGPAWDRGKVPLYRSADAMVIVFDLSRSMNSVDLLPSRLERARFKALEVAEAQQDRALGLVAFAGAAFDVTPISDDIATVLHLLQALEIRMMPVQGSLASEGLKRAEQLLENSGYQSGTVLLLTDDVDHEAYSAAESLRDSGYRLSVIAAGTAAGSPVALDNGDFLKDASGEFIVAPVDLDALAELASVGGGVFSLVTEPFSESKLHAIRYGTDMYVADGKDVSSVSWNDRGPWFLLALLPLAALIFRRGWILSVVVLFPLGTQQSHAIEWADLWQRSDQQAAAAVLNEDFTNPQLSEHFDWNGIALYRQNRFKEAAMEFQNSDDRIANYNRGYSLAKSGDLKGAVSEYEAALALDPNFEDARFNLDLVKQVLQQQQQGRRDGRRDDQSSSLDNTESADEPQRAPPMEARADSEGEQVQERPPEQTDQLSEADEASDKEQSQLMEQWLRVIPDEPAGLLRRRFHYEYHERGQPRQAAYGW